MPWAGVMHQNASPSRPRRTWPHEACARAGGVRQISLGRAGRDNQTTSALRWRAASGQGRLGRRTPQLRCRTKQDKIPGTFTLTCRSRANESGEQFATGGVPRLIPPGKTHEWHLRAKRKSYTVTRLSPEVYHHLPEIQVDVAKSSCPAQIGIAG